MFTVFHIIFIVIPRKVVFKVILKFGGSFFIKKNVGTKIKSYFTFQISTIGNSCKQNVKILM